MSWEARGYGFIRTNSGVAIYEDGRGTIAIVLDENDARLIAAAPEMVEELDRCAQDFLNLARQFPPGSDYRQIADNCALRVMGLAAKARGDNE